MISKKIITKNSPYLVEPNENPITSVKIALENNQKRFLKLTKLSIHSIEDYIEKKIWLPLEAVEIACNLNSNHIYIPITYQNVWFCLNKVRLKRQTPTKVIQPIVNFHSIYIKPNNKIIKLIEQALEKLGTKVKLGKLCCVKRQTVSQWITKKTRIKLTGFFKICQLLGKNPWKILDGCRLYGFASFVHVESL